ncbi:MAG: hypothetical protein J5I52_06590 [Saprospiraceae bacterium]|nr:MAG: hypothetical protein UZ09_BCD002001768 [Bacteroidetes bacterium OLB9]MCO6463802.1 hypothetical protein [Saprospiraceae bacterium]
MIRNIREIEPGVGVGGIKFGMTKDEVKVVLGRPDEIDHMPDEDGNPNEQLDAWYYDEDEISLAFDELYEWRLVSVSVSHPDAVLYGMDIMGAEKTTVLDALSQRNITEYLIEDEEDEEMPGIERLECDSEGLLMWFENDKVIEVQIFPEYDEVNNTLVWPE